MNDPLHTRLKMKDFALRRAPIPTHEIFISVCLVTYNRAGVLAATIDGILRQTHERFELIIADDCSPDDTENLCRDYMRRDSRIRYFRNSSNLSMPGNLNKAIGCASAEYIAQLHDGDVFRQDLLEQWLAALLRHPSTAFVFNQYGVLDSDGRDTGCVHKNYSSDLVPGRKLFADIVQKGSSPVHGSAMVRRSAYREVGLYDPAFGILSDVDMWMRLASKYDAAYVTEPLILLRPREPGHPWNSRVWTVFIPSTERILLTNVLRWSALRPDITEKAWRFFCRRFLLRIIRQLLADVFHLRFSFLADAVVYLPASHVPIAAKAGMLLQRLQRTWDRIKVSLRHGPKAPA